MKSFNKMLFLVALVLGVLLTSIAQRNFMPSRAVDHPIIQKSVGVVTTSGHRNILQPGIAGIQITSSQNNLNVATGNFVIIAEKQ